jgi:hypothetical protein
MRNGRKRRLLRRLVLGFALVAVAAPAAQARVYAGGSSGESAFIRPDDRAVHGVLVTQDARLPVRGDDKVIVPTATGLPVHADDKVFAPTVTGLPVHADDKVIEPSGEGQYSQFAYRRTLPQDLNAQNRYRVPVQVVTLSRPDGFDWGDAGTGAGILLGAALLAGGAARATRHLVKPATA